MKLVSLLFYSVNSWCDQILHALWSYCFQVKKKKKILDKGVKKDDKVCQVYGIRIAISSSPSYLKSILREIQQESD